MTAPRERRGADADPSEARHAALLAEVRKSNRLLAVLAVREMEKPAAIALLDQVGLRPAEIALAIGTTPNAVSIALHRRRKSTGAPQPQRTKLLRNSGEEELDGIE